MSEQKSVYMFLFKLITQSAEIRSSDEQIAFAEYSNVDSVLSERKYVFKQTLTDQLF